MSGTGSGATSTACLVLVEEHPLPALVPAGRTDVDQLGGEQRERTALGKDEVETRRRLAVPSASFRHALEDGKAAADAPRLHAPGHIGDPIHLGRSQAKALHHTGISNETPPASRAGAIVGEVVRSI